MLFNKAFSDSWFGSLTRISPVSKDLRRSLYVYHSIDVQIGEPKQIILPHHHLQAPCLWPPRGRPGPRGPSLRPAGSSPTAATSVDPTTGGKYLHRMWVSFVNMKNHMLCIV